MKNFTYFNPTKIVFGEGSIGELTEVLSGFGKNVLFAYGKGSIKKEGIYDTVLKILKDCGKNVTELAGIMPNPTATKVREGIALCENNNIDLILAVGGGSVIDCCKAIAGGSLIKEDFWDEFFEKGKLPEKAIPIVTVLTMVGTGSEMNGSAVITNDEKKIKCSFEADAVFPRFSILDPTYTLSLPQYQMISGICDMMSHIMEQYFSGNDDNVSDDLSESLMKSIIKNARIAVKNPVDLPARSNIMWAATLALNNILGCGKRQDWEPHQIEHQIAAYYDVAHGMGLAAISPAYYRHICKSGLNKFRQYAINVWDVEPLGKTDEQIALDGIDRLEAFFKEIGATTTLRELGISDTSRFEEIAESCNKRTGGYQTLTHQDIKKILIKSL